MRIVDRAVEYRLHSAVVTDDCLGDASPHVGGSDDSGGPVACGVVSVLAAPAEAQHHRNCGRHR
jgi:hypothetical protein